MWPKRKTHAETIAPPIANANKVAKHSGGIALNSLVAPQAEVARGSEVIAFDKLRTETHALMRSEYANRIATSPTPTPQEISFGKYAESLEPQVREATFQMRGKGYETSASGFFHAEISWRILGIEGEVVPYGTYASTMDPVNERAQTMDFSRGFELDQATVDRLSEVGAEAIRYPEDGLIYRIGFVPETPDLNAITTNWDTIASILPDTGTPVLAAETFNADFADWGAPSP